MEFLLLPSSHRSAARHHGTQAHGGHPPLPAGQSVRLEQEARRVIQVAPRHMETRGMGK